MNQFLAVLGGLLLLTVAVNLMARFLNPAAPLLVSLFVMAALYRVLSRRHDRF